MGVHPGRNTEAKNVCQKRFQNSHLWSQITLSAAFRKSVWWKRLSRAVPVAQWNATRPTEAKNVQQIYTCDDGVGGPSNPLSRDSNSSQHWTGCAPCLLHLQRERPDKSMTLGRLTCAQLSLAPTPPSSNQLEAIQPPKPHRSTHNFRGIRFRPSCSQHVC